MYTVWECTACGVKEATSHPAALNPEQVLKLYIRPSHDRNGGKTGAPCPFNRWAIRVRRVRDDDGRIVFELGA